MSDNPTGINHGEQKNGRENIQVNQNRHWVDLAKKVSIKPDLLDKIIIPNLSGRPDMMNEWVDGWIKPQTEFGESTDPTDLIGNLKYLSRVIYSDMYQVSVLSEGGNIGVMSLGGVITHVEFDEKLYLELQDKNRYTRLELS